MVIAIDFSLQNSAVTDPDSFHSASETHAARKTSDRGSGSGIVHALAPPPPPVTATEGDEDTAAAVASSLQRLCPAGDRPAAHDDATPIEEMNEYQKAIKAVGAVLGNYDTDRRFPVYALGTEQGPVHPLCDESSGASGVDGVLKVAD